MEAINISMEQINNNSTHAVIGFYYKNGVFDENLGNRGISYVLDHMLYTELCSAMEDQGKGRVRFITNYGYSEILISCNPQDTEWIVSSAESVLFDYEWLYDGKAIEQWIRERKNATCRHIKTTAELYYAHRAVGTPMEKTLSEGLMTIPTKKALIAWRKAYICRESLFAFISGNTSSMFPQYHKEPEIRSNLPIITPVGTVLPKHIPWRRSQMVCGIPCHLSAENMLTAEAYCELMRPRFAFEIRKYSGLLSTVKIQPDFFSELQISFQCGKGNEELLANQVIPSVLALASELSETQINHLRKKVYLSYMRMAEDNIDWNRFAGYNAITGNRQNLQSLLNEEKYTQHISCTSLDTFAKSISSAMVNVFATAVR